MLRQRLLEENPDAVEMHNLDRGSICKRFAAQ
jgi:hypothetical protein